MRKISKILIYIIIVIIFVFAFKAVYSIFNIKKISGNKEIINYYVLSNKDIKKRDLKKINIGYYKDDELSITYNKKYNYVSYADLSSLCEALLNNEIGAIIIEENLKNLVIDVDHNMLSNMKIVDKFKKNIDISKVTKLVDITSSSFNLYISGIDTYGDIKTVARSDANIIVSVNPNARKILLIPIPRDYYLMLHSKGRKDKLTHTGIYGIEESVRSLEDLLNIDINYYIKLNFSSLIDIVNIIDGVDVYSDTDFTSLDGFKFYKGYNTLYGDKALAFARERYSFADGDRKRVKNQEILFKAIIDKISSSSLLFKYDSILNKISSKIDTNLKEKDLIALITMQIKDNTDWNFEQYNLDGKNSLEYTYTYPQEKLYVMIPDEVMLLEARRKILEMSD